MVGWHQGLNGHEFEQAPEDGEGQGRLVCCSPRGRKESGTTERLNSNPRESACALKAEGCTSLAVSSSLTAHIFS